MMPRSTTISWECHTDHIKKVAESFLEENILCDVTLTSEGQFFKAHQFMLAACSSHFKEIFKQVSQQKHPVIVLNDISQVEIKALLDYIYKGETIVSDTNFHHFLGVCKNLKIEGFWEDESIQEEQQEVIAQVSATEAVEQSATLVVAQSGTETVEQSETEAVAQSATDAVEQSATKAVEQSVTEAVEQSATEAVEQSATEAVEKSATEAVAQSATEAVEQSATKAVEQSVTEAVEQSAIEAVEQSATEAVEQSATEAVEQSATEAVPQSATEAVASAPVDPVTSAMEALFGYNVAPDLNPPLTSIDNTVVTDLNPPDPPLKDINIMKSPQYTQESFCFNLDQSTMTESIQFETPVCDIIEISDSSESSQEVLGNAKKKFKMNHNVIPKENLSVIIVKEVDKSLGEVEMNSSNGNHKDTPDKSEVVVEDVTDDVDENFTLTYDDSDESEILLREPHTTTTTKEVVKINPVVLDAETVTQSGDASVCLSYSKNKTRSSPRNQKESSGRSHSSESLKLRSSKPISVNTRSRKKS